MYRSMRMYTTSVHIYAYTYVYTCVYMHVYKNVIRAYMCIHICICIGAGSRTKAGSRTSKTKGQDPEQSKDLKTRIKMPRGTPKKKYSAKIFRRESRTSGGARQLR